MSVLMILKFRTSLLRTLSKLLSHLSRMFNPLHQPYLLFPVQAISLMETSTLKQWTPNYVFNKGFALLSMKYKRPFNPTHKPYHNHFQAPHQSNPNPYYPKPSKNPLAYKPNIPTQNHSSESHETLKFDKPKLFVTSVVMQTTLPKTAWLKCHKNQKSRTLHTMQTSPRDGC